MVFGDLELGNEDFPAMNLTCLTIALTLTLAAADEDLKALPVHGETPPYRLVYESLLKQAHAALDRRQAAFEQLSTPERISVWQRERREFFVRQLGGLPERTPIKGEVVGKLAGEGFRIEKVIYESRPRHHVTALLYLPEGQPPFPAVMVGCGHSRTAKASDYNQKMCTLLARNGIAAFCYDPIGQGERSQMLAADGQPKHAGTTTEHFLLGVGSILVGTNTAQYRIWDAMRAIDYLATRPEIDAERIGATGCSGGGTESSYLMALDDRVRSAAPACYITTFRRLLDTIGPQDAEQNIFGQLSFGMDQPDYLLMRAAKPTLICATTEDFFDIQGSWDALRQAKRIYARLGFPERVDLVEADGKHGLGPVGRKAMVEWMRRWLLGQDGSIIEVDLPIRSEQELQCIPRGQVLLLADERSVYDLNAEREQELAKARGETWKGVAPDEARKQVRKIAAIRPLAELPAAKPRVVGSLERNGYRIDKLLLEAEHVPPLAALLFVPAKPASEAVLYIHGQGKHVDAAPGGPIEQLVRKGSLVLAIDVRGLGEMAGGPPNELLGAAWKEFYLAYLLGQSLVGLRAEDVLSTARFLSSYESGGKPRRVRLVAIGEATVPALHAAALEPQLFAAAHLKDSMQPWAEIARGGEAAGQLTSAVHGALEFYDWPDLRRLCAGAEVTFEAPAGKP